MESNILNKINKLSIMHMLTPDQTERKKTERKKRNAYCAIVCCVWQRAAIFQF